jgi:hypothetical protein
MPEEISIYLFQFQSLNSYKLEKWKSPKYLRIIEHRFIFKINIFFKLNVFNSFGKIFKDHFKMSFVF